MTYAEELEAAFAAQSAFMSDADVAAQIAEMEAHRNTPGYLGWTSTANVRKDRELILALRGEQARRQRVADEATGDAVNLLTALRVTATKTQEAA